MNATEPTDLRLIRRKTLTELEGKDWGPPKYPSHLVTTIHALRYKPIGEFSIEDVRITLEQKMGVRYLLPIALERLESNPLVAGDHYPGDLLLTVLKIQPYWVGGSECVARIRAVIELALVRLAELRPIDWEAGELPEHGQPHARHRDLLEPDLRAALEQLF